MDWSDGTYEHTAALLEPATRVTLGALGTLDGKRVLDVGCGTGNAALEAARRGATVTAVDPAARLCEVARARAAAEDLQIEVTVAEGGALPFANASFDALVSVFAVIFAPDATAIAREAQRVLAPGGQLALSAWTPEGALFEAGRLLWGALLPPGATPPKGAPAWGVPAFVRELFADCGVAHTAHSIAFEDASALAWFEEQEAHHPMWRGVRQMLAEREGAWDTVRTNTIGLLERLNEATTGFRVTSNYLVYTITRA